MKLLKPLFALILIANATYLVDAQSKEKIKGDRNVTVKQTYLDSFNTLIISDDFEVQLAFNSKPSVEIEADDNLHDIINVDQSAGVLKISTPRRITSKKKLLITVNYTDTFENIELYDGEIRSLTSMELSNFNLKVENNSRAYLNVKTNLFKFTASEKTKSRLNITADSTSFTMSDNSKLDALVSGKVSSFDLYQSANATIEGNADGATLRIDNSANFKGKNYTITNADVLIENNSDAEINTTTLLILKASGNSEAYIYGEPKIDLETFTDTAKLQKKK